MITEDYCSYEVSKLLKEKGFYQDFLNATIPVWKLNGSREELAFYGDDNYPCEWEEWYSAPTHQMAMKWLRMNHIIIVVQPEYFNGGSECSYWGVDIWADDNYEKLQGDFPAYEQAVEAALKYCLENLI